MENSKKPEREKKQVKKTRFLNFEVKKNFDHIIGYVVGQVTSWYDLIEDLNHSNLETKKQIEIVQSLLDGCSEVIGDYTIAIDPNDEETKEALIETLKDLYNLEEEEEEE